jgi:hypothetical protein
MIVMLKLFGLLGGWFIQECDLCVVIVGIFGFIVFSVVILSICYCFSVFATYLLQIRESLIKLYIGNLYGWLLECIHIEHAAKS